MNSSSFYEFTRILPAIFSYLANVYGTKSFTSSKFNLFEGNLYYLKIQISFICGNEFVGINLRIRKIPFFNQTKYNSYIC